MSETPLGDKMMPCQLWLQIRGSLQRIRKKGPRRGMCLPSSW